jgi:chromosome segregation ATPase
MESKLSKIEEKIDKLDSRLDSIDVTLGKQHSSLEHHIYRTELNEENIQILRKEMKPLSEHVVTVNNIAKIISVVAAIVAIYSVFKS